MKYVKWLAPVLLLVAGIAWAMPDVLATTLATDVAGFKLSQLLGWVAVFVGAWGIYELATKK